MMMRIRERRSGLGTEESLELPLKDSGSDGSNLMELETTGGDENGVKTSSSITDEEGFLDFLGPSGLAIVCGCLLASLLLCLCGYVWLKNRRRRQRLLKELTFKGCDESKITKSAPNSRCSSPRSEKRMSCPEAFAGQYQGGAILVKSLTYDPILHCPLTSESVQPKAQKAFMRHDSASFSSGDNSSPRPDNSQVFFAEGGNDGSQSPSGRIWFSAFYDRPTGQLNVNLIKASNLPKKDNSDEQRNPFVKIYLLPDDKTYLVSKYKKNTLNPVFNELHVFQVPYETVKDRVLRFSVYDMDQRRVRHSLGHLKIHLTDLDLDKGNVMCADLESLVKPNSSLGDLQISLAYIPAKEKVKIGIHKARKLNLDKDNRDKGAYVRIQLFYGHKCHRVKRTVTRPLSKNCPFDESLSFTIQGRQLESCSLVVSVMVNHQPEYGRPDMEYGHVVIGPFMYARGEELLHWQEMTSQPKTITTRWHSLVDNSAVAAGVE